MASDDKKPTKGCRAVRKWLAGKISADKCFDWVSDDKHQTAPDDIAYYLKVHVFPAGQSAPTDAQREDAEQVLLFLESRAEYRWPEAPVHKSAARLGCLLGCVGVLCLTVAPPVGMILWMLRGRWWLTHGVFWPLIGGGGLIVLCVAYIIGLQWRLQRKIKSIWANPRVHTNRTLDFCAYPFSGRQQMAEALASCPDFSIPRGKLETEDVEAV